MSNKSLCRRRLGFEGLEQRALLAVTAAMGGAGGTELKVTGDGLANQVDINHLSDGEFSVTSEEGVEGTFLGVTSIRVELKGGDDRIRVMGKEGLGLAGNVYIKMGQGADEVILGFNVGVEINGNVEIETSDGNDNVSVLGETRILKNLSISTGNEDDNVIVGGESGVSVGGNLTIKTGQGNDGSLAVVPCEEIFDGPVPPGCMVLVPVGGVQLQNLNVQGNTLIETSNGNDVVSVGGNSPSSFSGNFVVNTGLDDDHLQIGNGNAEIGITGLLDLNTSEGDDFLTVQLHNSVTTPATVIRTSDGRDFVTILDSIFASLNLNLGHGDDSLFFDTTLPLRVLGNATLNGSDGVDARSLNGLIVDGILSSKSFEIFQIQIVIPI
jgi:hypothetical protein